MKKEIVIKRVCYLASNMDYVFIPIKIPCWLLDNWFTEQYGGYCCSPISDKSKGLILEKLGSNSYSSIEKLYLVKTVRAFSNKTITLKMARDLIECSRSLTSLKYAPILVKSTSYIGGGDRTFRMKLGTDLTLKGIDPIIDEIFTKLIQDEEKL
jgi:hypothetical protein